MPRVPPSSMQGIGNGFGQSPLTQVSPENLLMAAAEMGERQFSSPSPKDPHPAPLQKRPVRKLKVVK